MARLDDPRFVDELTALIRRIVQDERQRSERAILYGRVEKIQSDIFAASVLLLGSDTPSQGFRYASRLNIQPGDFVRVSIDPLGGDRYIDEDLTLGRTPPQRTILTAAAGTYAVPAGSLYLHLRGVGGGGAGGGTPATAAGEGASAAGGGGAGSIDVFLPATILDTLITYAIGRGGVGANNADGTAGGDTSFGVAGKGYLCIAKGATGGLKGINSTGSNRVGGGTGGVVGTIPAGTGTSGQGDDGGDGEVAAGQPLSIGWGGGSMLGGVAQPSAGSVGLPGTQYGGGGSGALAGASVAARAGGAGAIGVLMVDAFFG